MIAILIIGAFALLTLILWILCSMLDFREEEIYKEEMRKKHPGDPENSKL